MKPGKVNIHHAKTHLSRLIEDVASGNEQASSVLDQAELIAEQHKVKVQTSLLQARDIGAALVDEAVESGVDA